MINFEGLIRLLASEQVEFIIVGGAAAIVHGASRVTQDLDIVYRRSPINFERLAAALAGATPYLRGVPPGLPFIWGAQTLAAGFNFTLITSLGAIDLLAEIPGGGSYSDLLPQALQLPVFGFRCWCLSLPQLITAKRAAGRPKDLEGLAELEAIAEEHGL